MKNTRVDMTGNGYCGPLVLAAIMGCTTPEAAERVRRATRQDHAIKGTSWWELRDTLEHHGFIPTAQPQLKRYVNDTSPGAYGRLMDHYDIHFGYERPCTPVKRVGPTLAEWMRSKRDMSAFYIVEVNHHWVLVKGRKFVDTYTNGEWVFLRGAPHRRKRVKNVWRVVPR